jgi:hypothetical protein
MVFGEDQPGSGRIETAQEWLGHTSAAHTRAYIDAEDYREKANGIVAGLDIDGLRSDHIRIAIHAAFKQSG